MISVIIPAYNEEGNVIPLYIRLRAVLDGVGDTWEIVFVDDGSVDKTFLFLRDINIKDQRVKIIRFRKNFGQSSALDAGFKFAKGEIIFAMDGDLQDDPFEIPKLLEELKKGYDFVGAWRFERKDSFFKKLFSKFSGLLRRVITRENVHDSGTTFRAYKRITLTDLNLFGEMHRYIPYLLIWKGFKFKEIKVKHHRRMHGKTKYGYKRLLKGFLDLLVVKFWMQYSTRPVHLFGGVGIIMSLFGFLLGFYLTIEKLFFGQSLANRPLLLLSVLLIILGIQFLIFGILADIQIRNYYKETVPYNIEKILE